MDLLDLFQHKFGIYMHIFVLFCVFFFYFGISQCALWVNFNKLKSHSLRCASSLLPLHWGGGEMQRSSVVLNVKHHWMLQTQYTHAHTHTHIHRARRVGIKVNNNKTNWIAVRQTESIKAESIKSIYPSIYLSLLELISKIATICVCACQFVCVCVCWGCACVLNEIIKRRIFVRAIKMEMKMKTVCVEIRRWIFRLAKSFTWRTVGGHSLLFVFVAWAPSACLCMCVCVACPE